LSVLNKENDDDDDDDDLQGVISVHRYGHVAYLFYFLLSLSQCPVL